MVFLICLNIMFVQTVVTLLSVFLYAVVVLQCACLFDIVMLFWTIAGCVFELM